VGQRGVAPLLVLAAAQAVRVLRLLHEYQVLRRFLLFLSRLGLVAQVVRVMVQALPQDLQATLLLLGRTLLVRAAQGGLVLLAPQELLLQEAVQRCWLDEVRRSASRRQALSVLLEVRGAPRQKFREEAVAQGVAAGAVVEIQRYRSLQELVGLLTA